MYHFKECCPQETVNKIKAILAQLNIRVSEREVMKSSIDTYSLVLSIEHTNFSTNGKGITLDLARASAYAELVERLSNDVLWPRLDYAEYSSYHCTPHEKLLSAQEIINDTNSFIELYLRTVRNNKNDLSFFSELHIYDRLQYGLEDKYVCIPFKNVFTDKVVYLPKCLYHHFYGTNGMCAGNSKEEALLQGISEIFERAAQKRLISDNPSMPHIPEFVLKEYPNIYSRIQKINESGYQTIVCDMSFEGELPGTVGIIYFKNDTGKYGVKIGCHPNLEIAIERALTEAAQGQELAECADRSEFHFDNMRSDQLWNLHNLYRAGVGDYKYNIFLENGSWHPQSWSTEKDLSILLNGYLSHIKGSGHEIFIRDNSYLDFNCYHVIIPGLSELDHPDEESFRFINSRKYIMQMLNSDTAVFEPDDLEIFSAVLDHYKYEYFEGNVLSYYFYIDRDLILGANDGLCCDFMNAICNLQLGEFENAYYYLQEIVGTATDNNFKTKCQCLMLYTESLIDSLPLDIVLRELKCLFSDESLEYVYKIINNKNDMLSAFYPRAAIKDQIKSIPNFEETVIRLCDKQKTFYRS